MDPGFHRGDDIAGMTEIGVDFESTNLEPLGFKPRVVQYEGALWFKGGFWLHRGAGFGSPEIPSRGCIAPGPSVSMEVAHERTPNDAGYTDASVFDHFAKVRVEKSRI